MKELPVKPREIEESYIEKLKPKHWQEKESRLEEMLFGQSGKSAYAGGDEYE